MFKWRTRKKWCSWSPKSIESLNGSLGARPLAGGSAVLYEGQVSARTRAPCKWFRVFCLLIRAMWSVRKRFAPPSMWASTWARDRWKGGWGGLVLEGKKRLKETEKHGMFRLSSANCTILNENARNFEEMLFYSLAIIVQRIMHFYWELFNWRCTIRTFGIFPVSFSLFLSVLRRQ